MLLAPQATSVFVKKCYQWSKSAIHTVARVIVTSRWERKVTLHATAPDRESFEESDTLAFTTSPRSSLELTSCLMLIKAAWNSAALAPLGMSLDTSPAKDSRKELNQYSTGRAAGEEG